MLPLPILYQKTKAGKINCWEIQVTGNPEDTSAIITTIYGFIDGEKNHSNVVITKGKNIGKSSKTTILEQAHLEAKSKWQHKVDKGYVTNINGINDNIKLPMLALDYHKRNHDIAVPFFVQPKLNGIRCLAIRNGNQITYMSRRGKSFPTLEHLTPDLLKIMGDGQIFDGEIYNHRLPLQEIASIVRSEKVDKGRNKLQYWIYDIADENSDFLFRNNLLNKIKLSEEYCSSPNIHIVQTISISDKTHIKDYHTLWIDEGYEGVIVRNLEGTYDFNNRNKNLQKYKLFESDEFIITGGTEGIGRDSGCIIFTCETKTGKSFSVRPKGTVDDRKGIFEHLSKYIGKLLTVNYYGLTNEGVPFHPVGETIRDYE